MGPHSHRDRSCAGTILPQGPKPELNDDEEQGPSVGEQGPNAFLSFAQGPISAVCVAQGPLASPCHLECAHAGEATLESLERS